MITKFMFTQKQNNENFITFAILELFLRKFKLSNTYYQRGCSSYGRALALHARGTGFDSPHLH